MRNLVDEFLSKLGLVRIATVKEKLDFAHSIDKRLDEHRELVVTLEHDTTLLKEQPWIISHLGTQDDYLIRIFHMVHGFYPEQAEQQRVIINVRSRPTLLGDCQLPEIIS